MRLILKIVFILVPLLFIIIYGLVFYDLPSKADIAAFTPSSTVTNLNALNFKLYMPSPTRSYVPLSQISGNLKNSVILSEDDEFYKHNGINMNQVKIVFQESWENGKITRGASTITMQLARTAFLSNEKSLLRKLKEIVIARRIEDTLSKKRILELYLNLVEWGPNIYGAEAASWYYFDKSASQLDLSESSLLAAILINPIRFNPHFRLSSARKLQHRVLKLLKNSRYISSDEMDFYNAMPIYIRSQEKIILY